MPPSITPSALPVATMGTCTLHGLVELHLEEVGVQEPPGDRVDLVLLEEDPLLDPVELQREEGVELVRGGDGLLEQGRIDRDVGRLALLARTRPRG